MFTVGYKYQKQKSKWFKPKSHFSIAFSVIFGLFNVYHLFFFLVCSRLWLQPVNKANSKLDLSFLLRNHADHHWSQTGLRDLEVFRYASSSPGGEQLLIPLVHT